MVPPMRLPRSALIAACLALTPAGAALSIVAPAAAQQSERSEEEQERIASEIASKTMSPFCPGRTLSSCPSPYATEWRVEIRRMVAEGKSAAEIQRELEKRAGGDLSGAPQGSSDWALPVGIGVFSLVLLGFAGRRLFRRGDGDGAEAADEAASDAELDERLDEELRRFGDEE